MRRAADQRQSRAARPRHPPGGLPRRIRPRRCRSHWRRTCRSPPASAAGRATPPPRCARLFGCGASLSIRPRSRASPCRSAPTCRCASAARPLVARGIGEQLEHARTFPGAADGAGQPGRAGGDAQRVQGARPRATTRRSLRSVTRPRCATGWSPPATTSSRRRSRSNLRSAKRLQHFGALALPSSACQARARPASASSTMPHQPRARPPASPWQRPRWFSTATKTLT